MRPAKPFENLDAANRYSVLFGVWDAANETTRAARVKTYLDMLARGDTPHPPAKKRAPKGTKGTKATKR